MKEYEYINSLQPNYKKSDKSQPEKKEIKPVVTGKTSTKKKGLGKRVFGELVANDAKTIGRYIGKDIILPAIKDMVSSTVKSTVDMALYGEEASSNKNSIFSSSYTKYYKYGSDGNKKLSSRSDDTLMIDDIIFETRGDAQEVLSRMIDLLETYGSVSVADFYDLAGETCDYTSNNYGWTKLGRAEIRRLMGGEGYYLDLPKPKYLE